MLEGSYTTSDQDNTSQPLPGTDPIKDEIEESEVTIAMLKAEILGAKRRVGFYLYGVLAIISIAVFIIYWSSFHQKELLDALDVNRNNLYTYLFFGFIFAGIFGLATLIFFGQRIISEQTMRCAKIDYSFHQQGPSRAAYMIVTSCVPICS